MKKRKKINEEIEMEKCGKYFAELLGGVEKGVVGWERRAENEGEKEEERKEGKEGRSLLTGRARKSIKDGKAADRWVTIGDLEIQGGRDGKVAMEVL